MKELIAGYWAVDAATRDEVIAWVKDLRTGVSSTAPDDVLDGELNEFMEAALAHRISGSADVAADID